MKKNALIAGLAFSLISIFQAAAQTPTNGLIGYWPFTGNANDLSGNGNNGTVHGATLTEDRFGHQNSAYYLDGVSNYISVVNSASLNPTTGFTVSAWYKSTTFTGAGFSPIIDKGFTSHIDPYYQYKIGVGGDYSSLYSFGFSLSTNGNKHGIATASHFWTADNWYFIVGTYDGAKMNFYVNNQLIQSMPVTGLADNYNTPMYFGNNTTADDFLKGVIDDIRLYNRALDSTEIKSLYEETGTLSGIQSIAGKSKFEVYPNPAKGYLTIVKADNKQSHLKIWNSLGQTVHEENLSQTQSTINIENIASHGLYFLQLTDEKGNLSEMRKVVIN